MKWMEHLETALNDTKNAAACAAESMLTVVEHGCKEIKEKIKEVNDERSYKETKG